MQCPELPAVCEGISPVTGYKKYIIKRVYCFHIWFKLMTYGHWLRSINVKPWRNHGIFVITNLNKFLIFPRFITAALIWSTWKQSIHCHQSLSSPIDMLITYYNDVLMSMMASQITRLTIVYSTVYSGADQRKHQSSAPLAFLRGIHRWSVNSPHKGPVTRKMFKNIISENIYNGSCSHSSIVR